MKICILGDTHHGMRNDSLIFHELYKNFYLNTLIPTLKEQGVEVIVQLGDLFDRRKYVNFNTLKMSKEYFFKPLEDNNIQLHTLLGNHDIFWKNTLQVNSTSLVLGEFTNVQVWDKPTTVMFGDAEFDIIPWICEENQSEVIEFIKNSRSRFCFGHFELAGFEMDRGNICHEGMDSKILSRYEKVWTGHFHHPSNTGNVCYVGAPGEMTWADYNDQRGFIILDTDTLEETFVANPYTIFRKFGYDDSDLTIDDVYSMDFSEYNQKYVKLVVVKKTNPFLFETLVDQITKAAPIDVTVVEDFTEATETADTEVNQADDTATILDKYVDNLEIDLNKSRLKSILREIHTEALAIES